MLIIFNQLANANTKVYIKHMLINIMAKKSKFEIGQKVESILNKHNEYEVVEVKKNSLVVSPICDSSLKFEKFECPKNIFEVIKNE